MLYSFSSAERSSCLKIVMDISLLISSCEAEVVSFSFLALHLAINVLHIVNGKALTFISVQVLVSISDDLGHSSVEVSLHLLVGLGVLSSQELVVGVIDVKLHGVLVVSEQGIVSICKISQSTSEIERVFNWRGVVHGSEEVVLGGEDNDLLKKAVAHQELLCGS